MLKSSTTVELIKESIAEPQCSTEVRSLNHTTVGLIKESIAEPKCSKFSKEGKLRSRRHFAPGRDQKETPRTF